MRHINIIAMKDVIISEKAREKEMLSKSIVNTITSAEIAWMLSFVDLIKRYNEIMSNADLDVAKKFRLTDIKKY